MTGISSPISHLSFNRMCVKFSGWAEITTISEVNIKYLQFVESLFCYFVNTSYWLILSHNIFVLC